MKVVWDLDTATVRDVYERLRARRDIAYTTVLTMMKILEQKGYVKKDREERAFVYRAARPRQQVLGGMVREFVDRVFDGASRPISICSITDFAFRCWYSTGSSMVMTWRVSFWLMISTSEASVVVFPDPVGPQTRISPRVGLTSSARAAGRCSCASVGTSVGSERIAAASVPRWRCTFTRNR